MMRIKEAIQRRKIIQELTEEWMQYEDEVNRGGGGGQNGGLSPSGATHPTASGGQLGSVTPTKDGSSPSADSQVSSSEKMRTDGIYAFVRQLEGKMNDLQKRALRVTWKRLSDAPKTSGRGTLQIMEKVFDRLADLEPAINSLFYRSAFLSCVEDRRCGRRRQKGFATRRDHAHLLIDLIDSTLAAMFEGSCSAAAAVESSSFPTKYRLDPTSIGQCHAHLLALGFERRMWHRLGECFAEVMFAQECVRAYPHAGTAWSIFAVTMTDRMYAACKAPRVVQQQNYAAAQNTTPNTTPPIDPVPVAPKFSCPVAAMVESPSGRRPLTGFPAQSNVIGSSSLQDVVESAGSSHEFRRPLGTAHSACPHFSMANNPVRSESSDLLRSMSSAAQPPRQCPIPLPPSRRPRAIPLRQESLDSAYQHRFDQYPDVRVLSSSSQLYSQRPIPSTAWFSAQVPETHII